MSFKAKDDLSVEQVLSEISYDPETGILRKLKGSQPYCKPPGGYFYVELCRGSYLTHRLAWLIFYGRWPVGHVDHINGDPGDNRIANLREVSQTLNMQNQRRAHRDSASGVLGVHWDKKKRRWKAQISLTVDGVLKTSTIGRFDTKEEAHAAYVARKRQIHPGCTL
jgi:hypothetical protein